MYTPYLLPFEHRHSLYIKSFALTELTELSGINNNRICLWSFIFCLSSAIINRYTQNSSTYQIEV